MEMNDNYKVDFTNILRGIILKTNIVNRIYE
jgi:hypothetical protein